MMKFVVPAAERITVPVLGSDAVFPVRRIYCVGRNFADHAVEMGHDPDAEPPFFFQKSADTIILPGVNLPYPPATNNLHFELELVLALQSGGANIAVDAAPSCIFGYAVGLDMTRRDLQNEAKKMGRPWEVGKNFDGSTPLSAIRPMHDGGIVTDAKMQLAVNGETRQNGNANQMIWKPEEIISRLSQLFTLFPGDLIMTGTPEGVGAVAKGDQISGQIERVGRLDVAII